MTRARWLRALGLVLLAGSALECEAAAADPPPSRPASPAVTPRELEKEIAALAAKLRAAQPDYEREQSAWEATVLQEAERPNAPAPKTPPRILAILALEPTEREPGQRAELAAYFQPRSKTLGPLIRELAAKRATLAALTSAAEARPAP